MRSVFADAGLARTLGHRSPSQLGCSAARRPVQRGRFPAPDRALSAEYVGEEDQFDQSVTDLAERYTEQIERDYRAFTEAVRSGRLEALEGA
jgi:Uncharacterized protein conserved in bacteria (DUF2252)